MARPNKSFKSDLIKRCVFCKKGFQKTYSLTRHLQLHTGARPFVCHVCNYGFIQKSDLLRHLSTHSEVFNYVCDFKGCGKKFKMKRNLQSHKAVHESDNIHHCKKCDKVMQSGSLRIHYRKFHYMENKYSCDHCGTRFADKKNLISHFRLVKATKKNLNESDVFELKCVTSIYIKMFAMRKKEFTRRCGTKNKTKPKVVVSPKAAITSKQKVQGRAPGHQGLVIKDNSKYQLKSLKKKTETESKQADPPKRNKTFVILKEHEVIPEVLKQTKKAFKKCAGSEPSTTEETERDRAFLMSFLPHLRTLSRIDKNNFKKNVRLTIGKILGSKI